MAERRKDNTWSYKHDIIKFDVYDRDTVCRELSVQLNLNLVSDDAFHFFKVFQNVLQHETQSISRHGWGKMLDKGR